MNNIEPHTSPRYALFNLSFRPFFLLGSMFAIVSVVIWAQIYYYNLSILPDARLTGVRWHAHEMIYGYGVAVIAGFLLTAVKNWTGIQTIHGTPLFVLAMIWGLARLMPYLPLNDALLVMAAFDLLFNLLVCVLVVLPIIKAKQWQQTGIWLHLVLLFAGNILFYLGLFNLLDNSIRMGLYTGLYVIISLIILMGHRVIPFFIEKGAGYPVKLRDHSWINVASPVLMLVFLLTEVYYSLPLVAATSAILLACIHALRLIDWHTSGLWKKPLLWVLYIGYGWIIAGFILVASVYFLNASPMPAVHAFAYGAIGMITIGMMARVSLGHTGHDVFNPPIFLGPTFLLVFVGSVVRVVLPLMVPQYYNAWVSISQLLWVLAFVAFTVYYFPVLVKQSVAEK
ncbi:MAG: NnrS family protein [Porticoccus sp.]|nr:NnrS family protein [Porticoccus sp.]